MRRMLSVMAAMATAMATAMAQDVVKVAPQQVKVVFENDQVRVLRFNEPVHGKLPMHSHPAYVALGFTDDHGRYTFPDGKTSEEHTKAGEVTYSKGVTHAYENLTGNATESIMVELKSRPTGAPAAKISMDAVKVDPKHYKVELENDQVRVLRVKYGPREKSVMHEHPASVAVMMTDMRTKFTTPDGKADERSNKARDAVWANPEKHLPENLGDKPIEVIVIELKK